MAINRFAIRPPTFRASISWTRLCLLVTVCVRLCVCVCIAVVAEDIAVVNAVAQRSRRRAQKSIIDFFVLRFYFPSYIVYQKKHIY